MIVGRCRLFAQAGVGSMKSAASFRTNRAGWTVVELVVTIGIIGVLTTIAFLRLDVAHVEIGTSIRSVGVALAAAQREAMVKHHNVVVAFDVPAGQIHIHSDDNNDFGVDPGEHTKVITLDDRVVFGLAGAPARSFGIDPVVFDRTLNGLPVLVFYRNGSASYGGGFYLTSRRAALNPGQYLGDNHAVEIERATGRVQWWQYSPTGGWTQGF